MTAPARRPTAHAALSAHLWLSTGLCALAAIGAAWGSLHSREWADLVAAIYGAFAACEGASALVLAWLRRRLVRGVRAGLVVGWVVATVLTLLPFAAIVVPRLAQRAG